MECLQWIVAGIFAALSMLVWIYFCYATHAPDEPPGSYGWPLIGETLAFMKANRSIYGVYDFVNRRHQRYGEVFKTKIFGRTHVFMPGIDVAKQVLRGEFIEFEKNYITSMKAAVGSQSLLCVDQQTHAKLRHLLGNLFAPESLVATLQYMDRLLVLSQGHWKQDCKIRVLDYAMDITFKTLCHMLFSLEERQMLSELRFNVDLVSDAMLCIPLRIPGTRYYRGMKAREEVMRIFDYLIKRRTHTKQRQDFLQSMITATENNLISETQMKDNMLTLIIAGQTTAASAMMWAVKYLDENPEVRRQFQREQMRIREGKTPDMSLSIEELNSMEYSSQVLKETLRMASIVAWFPRVSLKDCILEGFEIKKGWTVNIDARLTHLDPNLYENPSQFNPSRFTKPSRPYSFLAFGGGPRTCLGIDLAKLMIMVFLHRLFISHEWKVDDNDTSLEPWSHFPRLRNGCPIRVTGHDGLA